MSDKDHRHRAPNRFCIFCSSCEQWKLTGTDPPSRQHQVDHPCSERGRAARAKGSVQTGEGLREADLGVLENGEGVEGYADVEQVALG